MRYCDLVRSQIDRHFEGQLSMPAERLMRGHLPSCWRCRRYYERRILFASLDPLALTPEQRMLVSVGLARRRGRHLELLTSTEHTLFKTRVLRALV